MAFGRRFKRKRDGRIELRLSAEETEVLAHVTDQLRDALLADTDSPSLQRLFPPAYVDDPEKEAGFRALARDELLEARLAALDQVDAVLAEPLMDGDRAAGLMQSLNALRLVLGTRLDVTEDLFADGFDPAAPNAYELAVYAFLTWVQEAAVQAAADNLGGYR